MNIWLLHTGGPLRGESCARVFGYGYLAEAFAALGHRVLGWAPTHNLPEESRREASHGVWHVHRQIAVRHVHAPVWARHKGLLQLLSDRALGFELRSRMNREPSPDLIVAALPSLEWAAAAVDYGRSHGVPVIVDIRDRWPDSLLRGWPQLPRKAGDFALRPQRRKAEAICRNADALIGTSNEYLEWGLALAGREKTLQDAMVPEGCEGDSLPVDRIRRKVVALCDRGLDPQYPICLFSGPFDDTYDLETVIDSAGRLRDIGRKQLQFVFCGDGPKRKSIERRSRRLGLKNAHFLGAVDDTTLAAAASIAQIGLCPYATDAADGLPGQIFEQMSRRLAVVSSLPGEATNCLARHECGVTYDTGSVNALTNAINRLTLNPMLLESLRVNAYSTWSSEYQAGILNARLSDHLASIAFVQRRAA